MLVAISGYFNPLHVGHLEYIEQSKKLGDKLIVIVNNDKQAILKKGTTFMKEDERVKIMESIIDIHLNFFSKSISCSPYCIL